MRRRFLIDEREASSSAKGIVRTDDILRKIVAVITKIAKHQTLPMADVKRRFISNIAETTAENRVSINVVCIGAKNGQLSN